MPETIQRVPRGLANVLGNFSALTPRVMLDELRPTIDLLQMFGNSQRQQLSAQDAALAEGTDLNIVCPDAWIVLFAFSLSVVKTATMTALRGDLLINRTTVGSGMRYASQELGPFGATETGGASVVFVPPYPLLLSPRSTLVSRLAILGTDATAFCAAFADVGVLG